MPATAGYSAGTETNDVEMSYGIESVWGTAPATTFKAIRLMGETLAGSKQRTRPAELNPSAQASAGVTQQESAGGAINFALSYGTFDDLIAGFLGSDWSTALAINGVGGDITFAATGNRLTSTTAGKFTAIAVGQWIRIFGASAGNNGFYRVASKTTDMDIVLAGKTVTNETPAGTAVKVRGSMIRNGTLFTSFYLQKKVGSALWLRYPGTLLASLALSGRLGQFFTGSFNGIPKSEEKGTTDASTGGITAAPTGNVMDTVAGFQGLQLNDTAIAAVVQGVDLNLTREGAAGVYGLGSASAQGMIKGLVTDAGRLETLFQDFTLWDLFKSETGGRLAYRALDSDGAGYVFTHLNCKIMNPQITAQQPNGNVASAFEIEGNPDPVTGKTIQIDRFPSIP